MPDTGLGDSHFQDEDDKSAMEVDNKMLVTVKNHTILPKTATAIKGPRSVKNQKAIKTLFKAIDSFVQDSQLSVWDDRDSFIASVNRISAKSKKDQLDAFLSNPQFSGFFVEQWADFSTDFSGFNDENRKSKGMEAFEKEICAPCRLLVSELEHVVLPQSEVSFQVTLLNNKRLEDATAVISIIDPNGEKVLDSKTITPEEQTGKTCLTQFGVCTLTAPRNTGMFKIKATLKSADKEVHSSTEDLIVVGQASVKEAMNNVCFLDNSEESSDAIAALEGAEKVIFTANLSSWPDEILDKIVDVVKNGGKTLLLSDMTEEDIEFFNQSEHFDCKIESHWSSGANGTSIHYLPKDSGLLSVFGGENVLDHNASAVLPTLSLNELPGSTVFARSVSIKDGEIKTGIDLQMLPFGKGKIMFNQFSIFEGLETNALADSLFTAIVNML